MIDFCVKHQVGTLFIGNPHGVRNRDSGRHHNGRMAQWEYGKDIDYLTHKASKPHQVLYRLRTRHQQPVSPMRA